MRSDHSLTRRRLLQTSPGVFIKGKGAAERPNILWLIAEDLGPDLGCYGNQLVSTPNIDRLASQGTIYNRAYTTSPVCSPSRSAFNTGMYQTSIGAHHHRSHRDPESAKAASVPMGWGRFQLPAGVRVLSDRMREAGYLTSLVVAPGLSNGKTDWNFNHPGRPFDSNSWKDLKSHQPFYAQVNFRETHTPHEPAKMPIKPDDIHLPPYMPDHPVIRREFANYYGALQILDEKVGVFLKWLEDDGLADNTIVAFFGDNGRETLRGKCTLFAPGIHVPLIVRWPGHTHPGKVSDDLISMIDLVPTCLSLAGDDIPAEMQGQPFLGPGARKRDCVFAARDRIEDHVDRVRCVVTNRYHYMRNHVPEGSHLHILPWIVPSPTASTPHVVLRKLFIEGKLTPAQAHLIAPHRPPEELYDLQSDPHELRNLAESPEHQAVLRDLRQRLDKWTRETGDQGAIPEDPRVVMDIEEKWFRILMARCSGSA